jgi:hypothetical protein
MVLMLWLEAEAVGPVADGNATVGRAALSANARKGLVDKDLEIGVGASLRQHEVVRARKLVFERRPIRVIVDAEAVLEPWRGHVQTAGLSASAENGTVNSYPLRRPSVPPPVVPAGVAIRFAGRVPER